MENLVRDWTEKVKVSDDRKGQWARRKASFGSSFGKKSANHDKKYACDQENYDRSLEYFFHGFFFDCARNLMLKIVCLI